MFTLESLKKCMLRLTETPFEKDLLGDVFRQLEYHDNHLRFSNFAYSLRQLIEMVIKRLAPDHEVKQASWYKDTSKETGREVTLRQRLKYIIQKGLSDEFTKDELDTNPDEYISQLNKSFRELSNFTHINKKTYNLSPEESVKALKEVEKSVEGFVDTMLKCQQTIEEHLENLVFEDLEETTTLETFSEIDCLATHHNIEDLEISKVELISFHVNTIQFSVRGSLSVRLQWGSDGDMKKGDGLEHYDSIPFEVPMKAEFKDESFAYEYDLSNIVFNTDAFYN